MAGIATRYRNIKAELNQLCVEFDSNLKFKKKTEQYNTFITCLNCMAIGALMIDTDIDSFGRNLIRGAVNWKRLLEHSKEINKVVPSSYNSTVFNAIVCSRMDLAKELLLLSGTEKTRWEYDDEFYSAMFVKEYFLTNFIEYEASSDLKKICDEIDDYLEKRTPQVQFFRALLSNDPEKIISAFEEWNEDIAEKRKEKADSLYSTYYEGITRHVWIEGLAFIRLAELKGIVFPKTVNLIPRFIRKMDSVPDFNDIIYGETKEIPEKL